MQTEKGWSKKHYKWLQIIIIKYIQATAENMKRISECASLADCSLTRAIGYVKTLIMGRRTRCYLNSALSSAVMRGAGSELKTPP